MKLHIDFETASDLDLTEVGAYKYTTHPSTFIRCLCWAIDDGLVHTWIPGMNQATDELKDALQHAEVHAWNAQFERLVFQHLWPSLSLPSPTYNQYRCTMAQARHNGLPGALGKCAKLLRIPEQKTSPVIMKKAADASVELTPEEMDALVLYCAQDVRTERAIHNVIEPLDDDSLYTYQINERINDRGVRIDLAFCYAMYAYLEKEKDRLNSRLNLITGGEVTAFTQVKRIKKYLNHQGSLDAQAIEKLLNTGLGHIEREVLEIRQNGAKSSAAKYLGMITQREDDNRMRGLFQFAGAGQTGRFSSTRPQLHNLPRDVLKDADERIEFIKKVDYKTYRLVYDEPILHTASRLIRPALIPDEGKTFLIGDWSAVEARALPWLAGNDAEVEAWRAGNDRYIEDAANVFGIPLDAVTDAQRQAGKVVRLACGFGGKKGALLAMAEGYGMSLTVPEADRMAKTWHAANPWVEDFGKGLRLSAMRAVKRPGKWFRGYLCKWDEDLGVFILRCRLPSGRVISYHDVTIEEGQYGPELSAIKPREMHRERLWHGLLAENVTQATCNDLLRHAMMVLHSEGYQVVAHVHDELISEVPTGTPDTLVSAIHKYQELMEVAPPWAQDFPLVANVHAADRYTK